MHVCEEYEELISAYVDHELSNEESKQVERHCAVCKDCHREAEMLRDLKANLKENIVRVPAPASLTERISRINTGAASRKRMVLFFRRAVAFAAVLLVLVGVIFFAYKKEQSHFLVLHSERGVQDHIDNCLNCQNGSQEIIRTHMDVSIVKRDHLQRHLDKCQGCQQNIGSMVKDCMACIADATFLHEHRPV